ncbi:MAG: aminopeptidase N [Desulfurivibrio sp.]|nr:aminopeptidase N [Desulfurivibrio sp.]
MENKSDSAEVRPVRLADYRPPPYLVAEVELVVDLYDDQALVHCRQRLYRNPAADWPAAGVEPGTVAGESGAAPAEQTAGGEALLLPGEQLELVAIAQDGVALPAAAYRLNPQGLLLYAPPERFTLETTARIYPQENHALEGLYRSGGIFCSQCEPEGFRRLTWYLDRPDVSAPFTVTISAEAQKYPVLLAGGNPAGRGQLPGGRHWATFRDPFPKPSYLFALVAGDLAGLHDRFFTASGREVALAIYVEHHNREQCDHAMEALKKAMRWDEETFGLEYDLDHYLIVAVDDFNMGAMENKGLNIFNAACVLARPETATDHDLERIEAVIAHEYFHNWTGNRVTCRDWFQLSLKEGLTVFRDQLFSQSVHSAGVKRIEDIKLLRDRQFAEDAGPLAHPVRPSSYIEINNFYTLTVYEKGAELVRMLYTLLGAAAFRAGLRLYLARHDGGAATIEDFLAAMAEAGGRDLAQFERWYTTVGTPCLRIEDDFEPAGGRYRLRVKQQLPESGRAADPAAAGAAQQAPASAPEPLHIPLAVGLLAGNGEQQGEELLEVRQARQEFVFNGLAERPTPSLLRGFSAPVRLQYAYGDEQLQLLLAHDRDPFSRWEAGQLLSSRLLLARVAAHSGAAAGEPPPLPAPYRETYRHLITTATRLSDGGECSFFALLLALPAEDYLAEQLDVIEVDALHGVRQTVRRQLATALGAQWHALYRAASPVGPYQYEAGQVGGRRLRNLALDFLLASGEEEFYQLAWQQFQQADNMTDSLAALRGLVHAGAPRATAALADFARRWQQEPLVMDKWLAVQATAPFTATLAAVNQLLDHPAFRLDNPNRVRALIGAFGSNPVAFHAADGSGYRFLADRILELDKRNPQLAARLAPNLSRWRRYAEPRRALMRRELERLAAGARSRDLREVTTKSL